MRPSLICLPGAAIALLLSAGPALGAAGRPRIDPMILRTLQTGVLGPGASAARRLTQAPVLIELGGPATPAALSCLAGIGAELTAAGGRGGPLFYDRFVPAQL